MSMQGSLKFKQTPNIETNISINFQWTLEEGNRKLLAKEGILGTSDEKIRFTEWTYIWANAGQSQRHLMKRLSAIMDTEAVFLWNRSISLIKLE